MKHHRNNLTGVPIIDEGINSLLEIYENKILRESAVQLFHDFDAEKEVFDKTFTESIRKTIVALLSPNLYMILKKNVSSKHSGLLHDLRTFAFESFPQFAFHPCVKDFDIEGIFDAPHEVEGAFNTPSKYAYSFYLNLNRPMVTPTIRIIIENKSSEIIFDSTMDILEYINFISSLTNILATELKENEKILHSNRKDISDGLKEMFLDSLLSIKKDISILHNIHI